jgi:hypothetical protein
VTVRVGQAVDVVGQAGRPKAITGFATHTTPVLVAYDQVLPSRSASWAEAERERERKKKRMGECVRVGERA